MQQKERLPSGSRSFIEPSIGRQEADKPDGTSRRTAGPAKPSAQCQTLCHNPTN
jgi:hypothetical protein